MSPGEGPKHSNVVAIEAWRPRLRQRTGLADETRGAILLYTGVRYQHSPEGPTRPADVAREETPGEYRAGA